MNCKPDTTTGARHTTAANSPLPATARPGKPLQRDATPTRRVNGTRTSTRVPGRGSEPPAAGRAAGTGGPAADRGNGIEPTWARPWGARHRANRPGPAPRPPYRLSADPTRPEDRRGRTRQEAAT